MRKIIGFHSVVIAWVVEFIIKFQTKFIVECKILAYWGVKFTAFIESIK